MQYNYITTSTILKSQNLPKIEVKHKFKLEKFSRSMLCNTIVTNHIQLSKFKLSKIRSSFTNWG